jgi:hypothetical protein
VDLLRIRGSNSCFHNDQICECPVDRVRETELTRFGFSGLRGEVPLLSRERASYRLLVPPPR